MSQLPIRIIFGKEIIRLAEEYGYYACVQIPSAAHLRILEIFIRNVRFQLESLNKI